ncbi:hypothetical protein [Rickettsiella endosymbiont of Miltochrista miniata]|uniref:hypothetical protein n=1 Tax=Rickettsiella endosymbiont of Miltochrista miniata TaxID=3066239 RepID=UPI00313D0B50
MQRFFYLCFLLSSRIVEKTKKKIINLDNERLAIGLISILGLGLLLPLLVIAPGLFESEWFLNLLTVPAEYGSFVADGAYLGRLWNLFTARPYAGEKTRIRNFLSREVIINRQIGYAEKLFTPIGMLLGVSLGTFCLCLHAVIPFWETFSYFAYILFILGYACALGGLFNRLASSFDGTRLKQEKLAIFIGVVLGLIIALSLFNVLMLTGTMPFVAVIGISKPFIDLLLLHKFLFALPFVLSLTSLTTSCFDYFAKAYCFLKYTCGTEAESIKERIQSRYYEYKTAFLGISFGCLLALGITTGLCLAGSLVAPPIAIAATIFATIIISNNVLAALFSRLGRLIDGVKRVSTTLNADFCQKELSQIEDESRRIKESCLTLKRRSSLFALHLSSCPAKNRDINDNEIRFQLKRTQSSPTFFSLYNPKQEVDTDNELFLNHTLSGSKSLSNLVA